MEIRVDKLMVFKWFKSNIKRLFFKVNGVYIAYGTHIGYGVKISRGTRINAPSYLTACSIGAYCAIGGRLIIRNTDHYTQYLNMQDYVQKMIIKSNVPVAGKSKGNVKIGNSVWIGDSVIILSGVEIGDGAVIGAGSVVTKSIPSFSVAVGNPARVIKYRFRLEIRDILKDLKWWEWDKKTLKDNKYFFEVDLTTINKEELLLLKSKLKKNSFNSPESIKF
jgi:acetyltransferase-like isoleucine patch superfamily enzyme